jgi:hypothetical protein
VSFGYHLYSRLDDNGQLAEQRDDILTRVKILLKYLKVNFFFNFRMKL